MSGFRVVPAGDSCLSVVFEEKIDPAVNARCVDLAQALEREAPSGIRDVVPAYHTVAVYFDPLQVDRHALVRDLERTIAALHATSVEDMAPLEIPVRYGGESSPDLPAVARFAGCSEAEVVRLHALNVYRVYMLGFLPGFAYLGSVDQRIAMPRLETPRLKVQAGSVGIAGVQTGVYPCETPGGWRLVGRTDARPFDLARSAPFLFRPGARVRFVPA